MRAVRSLCIVCVCACADTPCTQAPSQIAVEGDKSVVTEANAHDDDMADARSDAGDDVAAAAQMTDEQLLAAAELAQRGPVSVLRECVGVLTHIRDCATQVPDATLSDDEVTKLRAQRKYAHTRRLVRVTLCCAAQVPAPQHSLYLDHRGRRRAGAGAARLARRVGLARGEFGLYVTLTRHFAPRRRFSSSWWRASFASSRRRRARARCSRWFGARRRR
jgi:hypothetical protein